MKKHQYHHSYMCECKGILIKVTVRPEIQLCNLTKHNKDSRADCTFGRQEKASEQLLGQCWSKVRTWDSEHDFSGSCINMIFQSAALCSGFEPDAMLLPNGLSTFQNSGVLCLPLTQSIPMQPLQNMTEASLSVTQLYVQIQ